MLHKILPIFMFFIISVHDSYSAVEDVDDYIKQTREEASFDGTILVSKGDKVVFQQAYGYANKAYDILNDVYTQFLIGSINKQFTAAVIMRLVEQNKLDLNKTINHYLPNFNAIWANKVTIHHLLTHTSGIPPFKASDNLEKLDNDALLRKFEALNLQFDPGYRFVYTTGYVLLAIIAEKILDEPLERYMQRDIFDKLEMNSTGYIASGNILNLYDRYKALAIGYLKKDNNLYTPVDRVYDLSILRGSSAMVSNVIDLNKWTYALYHGKVVSKESLEKMTTKYVPALNNIDTIDYGTGYYGYGIRIDNSSFRDMELHFHAGRMLGHQAMWMHDPNDDVNVFILINRDNVDLHPLALNIIKMLDVKNIEAPN